MFSLYTYGIQFILQYLIINLNCGCGQKTVYVNFAPFYSPYTLWVSIKSQGWSPVLPWEEIIEAERFTVILIQTRQNISTKYKLKKICSLHVRESINKFGIWLIISGHPPPPQINNKSDFRKISFVSWLTLYKILTFLLEVGLFKKGFKKKVFKNKTENFAPDYVFQVDPERKIILKYFFPITYWWKKKKPQP